MLTAFPTVQAQTADMLYFKHLTADDGLSHNSVYAIHQDRRGFLWFGTQDGLNRYDGYNFKVYKNEIGDSTSIDNNWITKICKAIREQSFGECQIHLRISTDHQRGHNPP